MCGWAGANIMGGTRMGTMPRKKKTSGEEPKNAVVPARGEFLFYQTEDGQTRLQVRLEGETVWLTQAQMADLFQTSVPNISMHIRNLFIDGELQQGSVVKDFLTTAADGKNYNVAHYNLDVIISAGYRVKSHRGTQFRIWATQRLREYIVKGFALDDERLKRGGGNYFDELLARIRDIRASERRRSRTSTPPAWTTIPGRRSRWISSRGCRTSCIGRCTATRQPS